MGRSKEDLREEVVNLRETTRQQRRTISGFKDQVEELKKKRDRWKRYAELMEEKIDDE